MTTQVSAQAFQFRDGFYALVPGWLATGNAERYLYTLETMRDLLCEKSYQAMTIRLPGVGDYSNLPYLAYDRQLSQGPAESNASFAARLVNAFATWAEAGSARAVIGQLQAYMQSLQPGVTATLPAITIVSNGGTWNQVYQDTPVGGPVTLSRAPGSFDWDGDSTKTWRNWLVLPMALVPVAGLAGSSAATSTAAASACFTSPGQNVGGVWVPATSGTPVNSPWLTLTGLTGLTAAQAQQWITLSGSSNPGNNGTFQIVQVLGPSSCVIANPAGVASDAGPLTWSVGEYPWIGPGPAWGAPGYVFGQGELTAPAVDTGSNVGGVWQPTTAQGATTGPTFSWGLDCSSNVIASLRGIVKTWKSAGTYYRNIVIAFDASTGAAGSAYSPNSTPGSGNPDGTFGGVGKSVGGVWMPSRLVTSTWDCYAQGTGIAQNCGVENLT